MKNINYIIIAFNVCVITCFSCTEKPIILPDLKIGERKIVVEELTGVRCPNCPDGTAELVALDKTYGENLIIVAVHAAGTFSVPYTSPPANKYDFRFPAAQEMADFLGFPEGFPTASVNRIFPAGATSIYLPRGNWAGIIANALAVEPTTGVYLITTFDSLTRKVDIEVNISSQYDLPEDTRLTVLLTQDSIIDTQQVGPIRVADYVHRHVLRKTLTSPTGDMLEGSLTAPSLITRKFDFILPDDWEAKHCTIVAFAHHGGFDNKEILQAEEVPIKNN